MESPDLRPTIKLKFSGSSCNHCLFFLIFCLYVRIYVSQNKILLVLRRSWRIFWRLWDLPLGAKSCQKLVQKKIYNRHHNLRPTVFLLSTAWLASTKWFFGVALVCDKTEFSHFLINWNSLEKFGRRLLGGKEITDNWIFYWFGYQNLNSNFPWVRKIVVHQYREESLRLYLEALLLVIMFHAGVLLVLIFWINFLI